MVLVYPPTEFESAVPGDFIGNGGWLGAAEKQFLALSTLCEHLGEGCCPTAVTSKRTGPGVSEKSVAFDPSGRKCEDPAAVFSGVRIFGEGVGSSFDLRRLLRQSGLKLGRGGDGGRSFDEDAGEGGEDDSWLGATEKRSLASGDITGGCSGLLFTAFSMSLFGGPGHPLKPWPPWPLATVLRYHMAKFLPRSPSGFSYISLDSLFPKQISKMINGKKLSPSFDLLIFFVT
jgi:hypothetical protein